MKTKLEKLNEIYEYLRSLGKVHTQKEFAEQVKISQTSMSSAFNVNEDYLTDNLLEKICKKYSDLFFYDKMVKNIQTNENINGNGIIENNVFGGSINDTVIIEKLFETITNRNNQINDLLLIIKNLSNKSDFG